MSKKTQRDFTQGSIPRHLLLFSLPMVAGNLLQMLYNTVDSIWVGRFLGPDALGAVSISFPLIFALLSLVLGVTMATSTLVSQHRGAGDEAMVRKTVANSMLILGIGGVIMSIVGVVFRYPLLRMIDTPPEIIDDAADYLGIFMAGVLGMFIYNTISAILRGLGDSNTPLKYLAVATVANIILDPLFIFGFGPLPPMGVAGVAIATILSQGVSAVMLLMWIYRHTDLMPRTRADWQPEGALIRQILGIGLPGGVQQVLVSFGMVAVTTIINGFGPEVVAAFGAASRLDQIAWLPAMSIGLAVTALVGQNLGAGRFDRVRSTVHWASLMAVVVTGLVTLLVLLKPSLLIVLFTDDPGVLAIGVDYLKIMAWSYIPFALLFVFGGVMRGAGDTLPSMILTLLALWGARVPMAAYLSKLMGSDGIWLGIALSGAVGLVLNWGYYLSGRWKRRLSRRSNPALDAAAD